MPPRKRKAVGKVQPKVKKSKQQNREETPEERNRRLAMLRERAATSRASETVQQREVRLQDIRDKGTKSKASWTVQQCEVRLQDLRDRVTNSKATWTLKQCDVRLQDIRNTATISKASETVQQCEVRLQDIKDLGNKTKATWTLKQCEVRLQDIRTISRVSKMVQEISPKEEIMNTMQDSEAVLQFQEDCRRGTETQETEKKMEVFICFECGMTFKRREMWEIHLKIHERERSYSCDVCGNGFGLKSQLDIHMLRHVRRHTGSNDLKNVKVMVAMFPCFECGKIFKSKDQWENHLKTHMPKSAFCCGGCGITFKHEYDLKRHMVKFMWLHTMYCFCTECKMYFKSKSCLEKHNMQFHSLDRASLSDGSNSLKKNNSDILSTSLDVSKQNNNTLILLNETSESDDYTVRKKDCAYDLSLKPEASCNGVVTVKKENLHFESESEHEYESIQSSSSPSDILVQSENQTIKTESEKGEFNISKPFPEQCNISDRERKENVGEITSRFSTSLNEHSGESRHTYSGKTQSVLPLGEIGEQETDQIGSGNENCEDHSEETWSSSVAVWTGLV